MPIRTHVAIRREGDDRIVALGDGSLPVYDDADRGPWQAVGSVIAAIRDGYGLDVAVLRAAWIDDAGRAGLDTDGHRLYEAELLDGTLPPGSRWLEPVEMAGGGRDVPDPMREAVAAGALDPAAGDRQPWYAAGWLAEMSEWIEARLADAGIRRRGPIRQERSWGRAALLTIDTDRGRLWAKAVPDVFAHEVAVTELLADIDPGAVPPVVAADRTLGRIITEHVDGPVLASIREPAAWTATMSRLAELQRVLAADPGGLVIAGVVAAPLDGLADALPRLLGDDRLLLVGRPGGLSAAEAATLRARVPELADACRRLGESPIPASLEHGDLTPDQVIVGDMGPVFLDWSDGSIAHPFLSAASFLLESGPAVAPAGPDLVDAYLGPWLAMGHGIAASDARQALDLARTVVPLHMAALYADRILPGLEQPWEMDRMVPRALRTILPR